MPSQVPPKKNAAFTLYFTLFKNDGTVIANPGTFTKKVSVDGAAVADISAAVTKEDTTYGQCSVVLSAGEMNGDAIWVSIKDDTTGCVPYVVTLYTGRNTGDETSGLLAADTAQSAASAALVLAAATAFANDEIIGATVLIVSGTTGVGQSRTILDYVSSTKTATVDAWTTTPTGTIGYVIFATPPSSASAPLPANVVSMDAAVANQAADALLNRDMSTGTDTGSATVRTARQALRFLRNKWTISGATLSVKKEDDATESWAGTVTTNAAADPITGNDPASA